MVKTPTEVKQIVEEYVRRLEPDIRVEKVILYGSYANGQPTEWSDIDLAVISENMRGLTQLERAGLLARKRRGCSSLIEALGYAPEEYENAHYLTFLGEIKHTGLVIYEAEKQAGG